jgi:hypothetical protein
MAMTSGTSAARAAGASTLPLITVAISDSGGLNP